MNQWNDFYDKSVIQSPFTNPNLLLTWFNFYTLRHKVVPVVCIAHFNNAVLLYPLCIIKGNFTNFFINKLVPMGFDNFDYLEPLLIDSESCQIPTFFYRELGNEIKKQNLGINIIEIRGLRKEYLYDTHDFSIESICPQIVDLPTDVDVFIKQLKQRVRTDAKRQLTRLNDFGKIELKSAALTNLINKDALLNTFLQWHTNRWPQTEPYIKLYAQIITEGDKLAVDFSILFLNNEPISCIFAFSANKTYYYYMPAMDVNYANYSPGKVHLYLKIQEKIQEDYTTFDLLRGNEPYKNDWANKYTELHSFYFPLTNFISKIKLKLIILKRKLKHAKTL